MNWGFCLFNKSLQGTCFNWIATSTAKQIKICITFPQPFQGVKPVIWLKTKPGLSAQVWCNYALLLSHWGISLELIIFHRSQRLDSIFASPWLDKKLIHFLCKIWFFQSLVLIMPFYRNKHNVLPNKRLLLLLKAAVPMVLQYNFL